MLQISLYEEDKHFRISLLPVYICVARNFLHKWNTFNNGHRIVNGCNFVTWHFVSVNTSTLLTQWLWRTFKNFLMNQSELRVGTEPPLKSKLWLANHIRWRMWLHRCYFVVTVPVLKPECVYWAVAMRGLEKQPYWCTCVFVHYNRILYEINYMSCTFLYSFSSSYWIVP